LGGDAARTRESVGRFYALHAGLPALGALLVLGAFEATNLDVRIENLFYDPVAQRFPYRVHYLFETVIHDFGRLSIVVLGGVLVALVALSFRRTSLRRWRRGFLYAALSLALAPISVAQMKAQSVIHCPRDLSLYGDDQPYVRLFDPVPEGVKPGHCWPGGHSSGGFAIMSLYFVFRRERPRLARAWLAGGFLYGFGLGFGRVVQGAHFVSHNLWAAAVCWTVALLLYELVLRRHEQRATD
jgi:membrane-associated PAP2 superfamily phosphatase